MRSMRTAHCERTVAIETIAVPVEYIAWLELETRCEWVVKLQPSGMVDDMLLLYEFEPSRLKLVK
jgi:hypothetical protein